MTHVLWFCRKGTESSNCWQVRRSCFPICTRVCYQAWDHWWLLTQVKWLCSSQLWTQRIWERGHLLKVVPIQFHRCSSRRPLYSTTAYACEYLIIFYFLLTVCRPTFIILINMPVLACLKMCNKAKSLYHAVSIIKLIILTTIVKCVPKCVKN